MTLSYYIKRVTAKVLNAAANLTTRYTLDNIKGVYLVDGIATVKIEIEGAIAYLPFNAEQFKAMVEAVRRAVLAAISTEQAWARRKSLATLSRAMVAAAVAPVTHTVYSHHA